MFGWDTLGHSRPIDLVLGLQERGHRVAVPRGGLTAQVGLLEGEAGVQGDGQLVHHRLRLWLSVAEPTVRPVGTRTSLEERSKYFKYKADYNLTW